MFLTSFLFTGAALLATGVTATTAESGYSRYGGYNGGYSGSNYGGYGSSSGYGGYGSKSNYGGYGSSSSYGGYGSKSNYGGYGSKSNYGGYGYGSKSNYGGYGYGSKSNYGGYGSSSGYGGYGGYGGYSSGRYGRRYKSDSYDSDSWRDSYGHDSYGSDSYGHDSYGHDSYGSDSYGHDSYGKDSYGKDSYGKDSYGKDSYGGDDYGDDGGHKGAAIYKNDEAPKADGDYSVGNWLVCEEVGIITFKGEPDELVRLEANDQLTVEIPSYGNVSVTSFEISQITSLPENAKSYGPQPAYAAELFSLAECDDYDNTRGSRCPNVFANGLTVVRAQMEGVASFIDNHIDFYNSYLQVWDGSRFENTLPVPRELDTITCGKKGKGIACDFKFRENIRLSFLSSKISSNELMAISSGYYVQDLKECPNYDY